MRNPVSIIALLAFLLCAASVQAQSAREQLLEGKALLTEGANYADQDQLLAARTLFEQAFTDDSLAIFARYYAAMASTALVNILTDMEESNQKRTIMEHVDYAIDHLETTTLQDESFAEGWLLLSAAYGQKMEARPLRAVALSRKFNRAMSRARELEPDNPRVVLLRAITDYNLPRIVGGNKDRGLEGLYRAARLFEEEVVEDPVLPSWGRDDTYARIGIVFMDRDNLEEARTAFERALEINPEFGWVKNTLLPTLEAMEAEAAGS